MYVILARVSVKPDKVEKFLEYLAADRRGSLQEVGCLRFDVLRDLARPNLFHLYEVYADEAAYELHKQAPYLQAMFREAGDTLEGPPEGHAASALWPADAAYWQKMG